MSSLPADIAWALSRNQHILPILLAKYPASHGYWSYLDKLVGDLRRSNCQGIQDKMTDVGNNFKKFDSAVSELEIANLLCAKGKRVELLPDSFLAGKSPDMLVSDKKGQYYVEVTRFSEDETETIIIDELRQFLANTRSPYQVDVTIPDELSLPVTDHRSRQAKEDKARQVVKEFERVFASTPSPPPEIVVDEVIFTISSTNQPKGYPGLVNSAAIVVPSHKYVARIRYLVTWKAEKRASWTGNDLKMRYIIAIDTEQSYVEQDDLIRAVLGSRTTERIIPLDEVAEAAKKNWARFLEETHLIPKDRTYLASKGVFLSDPVCRHASAVLVRKYDKVWFVPNPFASDEINDSGLVDFLS